MSRRRVAISDDYATIMAGQYDFYYGYEETEPEYDPDNEDADYEWCFVVYEGGDLLMKLTTSELVNERLKPGAPPEEFLLEGIARFIEVIEDLHIYV